MNMKRLPTIILVMSLAALPLYGIHWDIIRYQAAIPPSTSPEFSVAIGCELRGCCPGCPLLDPIDIEIQVDARVTQEVRLRFAASDSGTIAALQLKGNIRREGSTLIAGPGTSMIVGVPPQTDAPLISKVRPVINANKWQVTPNAMMYSNRFAPILAGGDILIVQSIRGHIVNVFRYRYPIVPKVNDEAQDQIKVSGNTSGNNVVILADLNIANICENDVVFRTTSTVGVGSALSTGNCPSSDVSVFSYDNAMSYETNVTSWTQSDGDVHQVNLQPIIVAPMNIVVTRPGGDIDAQYDVGNANYLYNENKVGVQFDAGINDVSQKVDAVKVIEDDGCVDVDALHQTIFYVPGRLNVYYVHGNFTAETCGNDKNLIFVGEIGNRASLAHEIGHAYGLIPAEDGGHTNGEPGFGNDNIMYGGGPPTRSQFSTGQVFRLNVCSNSQLNLNGNRSGQTQLCLPHTNDEVCPALSLAGGPH
jgi:hypothetical protein